MSIFRERRLINSRGLDSDDMREIERERREMTARAWQSVQQSFSSKGQPVEAPASIKPLPQANPTQETVAATRTPLVQPIHRKPEGLTRDDHTESSRAWKTRDNQLPEGYFDNTENIRIDLNACLEAALQKHPGRKISLENLVVRQFENEDIITSNGITMRGITYLDRAAIAFGLAETTREARKQKTACLTRLKEKLNIVEIIPRRQQEFPQNYFSEHNQSAVRIDLKAFLAEAQKNDPNRTLENMVAKNIEREEIITQAGFPVKGQSYLCKAAIALGFARNDREARPFQIVCLTRLKEIIGIREVVPWRNARATKLN